MKITLKLSNQQLNTLVYCFDAIKTVLSVETREVKVSRFVLEKVALKIRKKHLETQMIQTNLFAKKKKINFGLEYFEAHFLEQFLIVVSHHPLNEYDRNVVRHIQSTLNQQLA
ncbi:hypothetical protein ACRASX_11160 [Flavobacterium sp. TMP13]|uniref:hypothetical protein n=1 Tax=Flavobacterium sp. TMP13 TaxID=3425950 RepID=UPI003D773EE5